VREQGGLPDVVSLLMQTDNVYLQLEAAGTLSVLSQDGAYLFPFLTLR
jgi:hypothetical protein